MTGRRPALRGLVPQGLVLAILLCTLAGLESLAHAQATPSRSEPLPSTADLDGTIFALGPVAAAVYADESWDGGFGGEVLLVRVREGEPVAALGIAAGGIRFAQAGNGRLWADLLVGTQHLLGVGIGLSGGLAVEVGDLQRPKFGWQATLTGYAGVLPYLRLGDVEGSGFFVDAGIKIVLPAIRWR